MDLIFFDARDKPVFVRNDAESATWTAEEMTIHSAFPFDAGKEITRGMRVAFTDSANVLQVFELRKVSTYEPDHYQEIDGEHIAIAELTDEHYHGETYSGTELTDVSAASALATALTGTLWSVGNDTTQQETSSGDLGVGSVWQCVNAIKKNWNVYITPRVTMNTSGITGRYLDIAPAEGIWTGIRLSFEKNINDAAVSIDDSETVTALYGYGAGVDGQPLNFGEEVWTATAEHPAKPDGQTYLEDPAATASFGRNGRARFGYYQNTDITDAETLLEKTWETLKTASKPKVTISGTVNDLKRLGYVDQPIVLHGIAETEILQTNYKSRLEIIQLTVDLLNPLETRLTIGEYIPNIIYIQRETATRAGGGGGGGYGNAYGAAKEETRGEFWTSVARNNYLIELAAYQADLANNILRAAGISIDAGGVAIYANDEEWNVQSKLDVTNSNVGLVVSGTGANASVNAASIVAAINNAGSSVIINADKIYLNGQTNISSLFTGAAVATALKATLLQANETFNFAGHNATWRQMTFLDENGTPTTATFLIQRNASRSVSTGDDR